MIGFFRLVWNGPVGNPDERIKHEEREENEEQGPPDNKKQDLPTHEKPLRPADLPPDTDLHPDFLFKDDRIPGEILFRDNRFPGKVFSYARAFLDDNREPYDLSSLLEDDEDETGAVEQKETTKPTHADSSRPEPLGEQAIDVDARSGKGEFPMTKDASVLESGLPARAADPNDQVDISTDSRNVSTANSVSNLDDAPADLPSLLVVKEAEDDLAEQCTDMGAIPGPYNDPKNKDNLEKGRAIETTGDPSSRRDKAVMLNEEAQQQKAPADIAQDTSPFDRSLSESLSILHDPLGVTPVSKVDTDGRKSGTSDLQVHTPEAEQPSEEASESLAEDLVWEYYEAWGQWRREQDETFERVRSDFASKEDPLEGMKLDQILGDLENQDADREASSRDFWDEFYDRHHTGRAKTSSVPIESLTESVSTGTQGQPAICTKAPCANDLIHQPGVHLPDCDAWFQGLIGLVVVFYFFLPHLLPKWVKKCFGPMVSPQGKRQWWWCRLILGVTMVWSTNWGFPEGLLESVCNMPNPFHWPQIWYCPDSAWPIFRIRTDDWSCERRW